MPKDTQSDVVGVLIVGTLQTARALWYWIYRNGAPECGDNLTLNPNDAYLGGRYFGCS